MDFLKNKHLDHLGYFISFMHLFIMVDLAVEFIVYS